MSAPINNAGEKGLGWLFIAIVLIFIVGAFLFTNNGTFEEHSVVEDLDSMIYAIQSLTYGDIDGFTDQHIDLSNYSVSSLKEDLVMLQEAFNYQILERIDDNTLVEVK